MTTMMGSLRAVLVGLGILVSGCMEMPLEDGEPDPTEQVDEAEVAEAKQEVRRTWCTGLDQGECQACGGDWICRAFKIGGGCSAYDCSCLPHMCY